MRTGAARPAAVALAGALAALAAASGPAAPGPGAAGVAGAQEADAAAPGGRQGRVPDTAPAVSGTPLPPVDSLAGDGPRGQELDELTARVAARLRCPVCRSQSVLESSATLSQEMQREIRRRLATGQSPKEVEAYFVSRYGEWILLKPEPEGINLLVYLLPAAALLGGGLLVWNRIRAWTGASGAGGGNGAPPADAGAAAADGGDASPADVSASSRGGGEPPAPTGGLSREEDERIDALIREREHGEG